MDTPQLLERMVGAVGVPSAVLFALLYMAWRVGKWGLVHVTPHIPVIVAAYKLQAEAHASQAAEMKLHTGRLDEIHGDVRTVKGDVGEIKAGVKTLVDRK